MSSAQRLRMGTKLAFGIGAGAEAAVTIGFNTWNFLFYNHVLGLSGKLCGLAVTVSLVLDAIADPVIGFVSDRWHSPRGRRHPFLYAAAVPLALSFYCIYSPPAGLKDWALFGWFTLFTVLFRQSLSLYQVPHLALGAELSSDYRERSIVMSYNAIFAVVGGASTYFWGWTWFKNHGGTSVQDGYSGLAGGVGVFAMAVILASAFFTRDQVPRLVQAPRDGRRFSLRELFAESWACFNNRNYVWLLCGLLFISAALGTRETLNSYLSLFYWGLPEDKIRVFGLVSPPAFVIAFVLTQRLHHWFDKRETIIGSVWVMVLAIVSPIFLRMAGMFPVNGAPSLLPILALFVFVAYGSGAVLTISVLSALADVADEYDLATGRRQEGVFFAARTFFAKMTGGLGTILAGIAIDVIAFPQGAKPGEVGADVLFKLGLVDGPIAAIPALISIYCYSRYRITKQRHAEIQRELALRRANKPAPAQESERPAAADAVVSLPTG
jgi:GPH family glycoside/pentoside/hexuronide:cation symporter